MKTKMILLLGVAGSLTLSPLFAHQAENQPPLDEQNPSCAPKCAPQQVFDKNYRAGGRTVKEAIKEKSPCKKKVVKKSASAPSNDHEGWLVVDEQTVSTRDKIIQIVMKEHVICVTEEKLVPRKRYIRITVKDDEIPYGSLKEGSVQSPWSKFTLSLRGKTSGEILYDTYKGLPFRMP